MEIDAELVFRREPLHRLPFPDRRVILDIAADQRRQDEEAAIDPAAIAHRLFLEPSHAIAQVLDRSEAARRLGRGHGGEPSFLAMQIDRGAHVDVANSISVGQTKFLIVAEVGRIRLMRPPIMVPSPVSTSVTRHGSAVAS